MATGYSLATAVDFQDWVSSKNQIFVVWENYFWLAQQCSTADKNLSATKEPSRTRKKKKHHHAVTAVQHEQQEGILWLCALTLNEYYRNTLTRVQAAWTRSLFLDCCCWCYLDAAQIMTSSTHLWLDTSEGQPFSTDKTKWTPQWKLQRGVK